MIYITNYSNKGFVYYLKDSIPSRMQVTPEMIKESEKDFKEQNLHHQLMVVIEKYHTKENHVETIRETV